MENDRFKRLVHNFLENPSDISNNDALFSEMRRRGLLSTDSEILKENDDLKTKLLFYSEKVKRAFMDSIREDMRDEDDFPYILCLDPLKHKSKIINELKGYVVQTMPRPSRDIYEHYVKNMINYEEWYLEIKDELIQCGEELAKMSCVHEESTE
jgi:hypothetical protein